MIIVKDKNMIELGILENAYNIATKRTVNELWQSSFSLPKTDPKNDLCSHLNFIEITSDSGRYYGMYRIMPTQTAKSADDDSIAYTCEHVLAILLDDVMDGYYQFSGNTTAEILQGILDLQETERWVLGQVDFVKYFEYSFENENGLLAPILSIPKPFNEPYEFTFDTLSYPWTLNLISSSNDVKAEIRWGKDMIDFNEVSDPTDIVNYLIPKGTGEGVNQLNIARVNGGLKYLKDDLSIAKWGKRSYIWIDKSSEDATSLKANAQSLLDQWKEPKISFEVSSADLSILPEYSHEQKVLNGVTRIIVEDKEYTARIIGEEISDLSKEYDVKYQINNKLDDIATTQADLERKQQVSDAYSQGATNIFSFTYQDNCDSTVPALIPFYIDDDVVNVNTCELTFRTKPFRIYTKGNESAIQSVQSTSSGGNQTATSDERGSFGTLVVGSGVAEPVAGTHMHYIELDGNNWLHAHDITINPHTHEVTIPAHNHGVTLGMFEVEMSATEITITVDGNVVEGTDISGDRLDLVDYMEKDADGKVTRGRHEIEISPNNLARIEADVILRVFIQSRIGGVY